MAYIVDRHETDTEKTPRFNSELAVALGFNLAAWLVVGVVAVLIIV